MTRYRTIAFRRAEALGGIAGLFCFCQQEKEDLESTVGSDRRLYLEQGYVEFPPVLLPDEGGGACRVAGRDCQRVGQHRLPVAVRRAREHLEQNAPFV